MKKTRNYQKSSSTTKDIKKELMAFQIELEKVILRILRKHETMPKDKNILRKNRAGRIMLHDLIVYYKPTVIKIVWDWNKNRNINQRHRIES